MGKYCIISFVYEGIIVSDYHDLSLEDFERTCKKAVKEARKKGVDLYFKEVYNERIVGDSFALVEYNFVLDNESKIKFTKFIKSFFDDWDYTRKGIRTINTLKAVRFLKVDGEMIKIN